MNVSRETKKLYEFPLEGFSRGDFCFDLENNHDLLPFFLYYCRGSAVVVDDKDFGAAFNSLYRSGLPGFCVLTDVQPESPPGFVSPLKKYRDRYLINQANKKRVVLVNETVFKGRCDHFMESEKMDVDLSVNYNQLVSCLKRARLERAPAVVLPGSYALRGSVVDFYPQESSFPVRVDFSFDEPLVFSFNPSTQITTSPLASFSFKVSSSGLVSVKTSTLLTDLKVLNYSGGILSYGLTAKKTLIKAHKHAFYRSWGGPVVTSDHLHSWCLVFDGHLFVPRWFLDNNYKTISKNEVSPRNSFDGLEVGGLLVHEEYGLCVFEGLIDGSKKEESVVLLRFEDGKIALPVSKMHVLSLFSGNASGTSLNSLSKKALWNRRISSVSKKADQFVKGLLEKHVRRTETAVFRPLFDHSLLNTFVSSFKHQDTLDQRAAYKEVLSDLSSPTPMDRLLCGDVGFGKTEIAIRASFITVLMGGNVVVLAPTTVLCYQLYNSFNDRLGSFAVKTKMLSRLNSEKEKNKIIGDFNSGNIDVIVSTHKIFGSVKSITKLNLLIIDEEHKFGVKQKNVFLDHFPTADVLFMSATPIPRSLQSALSGIKTMSTISTPPVNRLPIQTVVSFFDINSIVDSVDFEIGRAGQVYFLHNNISSLNKIRRLISEGCKNADVRIVHGKMSPSEIEKTIREFSDGGFNVLISTTIIENGLDIPNVNTIIINNAQMFGLSQLHQIRGRVGRHDRQAFAYLLVPKSLKISKNTKERLKSLETNTALGSGHIISTKDLEIRGAGSLFGYNQSGGSFVGFDLYNKILSDSLFRQSGKKRGFFVEKIIINIYHNNALFPLSYIEESGLRISLYKQCLVINDFKKLTLFKKNIENRFGVAPTPVENLFKTQFLKITCFNYNINSIIRSGGKIKIVFLPNKKTENIVLFFSKIKKLLSGRGCVFKQASGNRLLVSFKDLDENEDIYVFLNNFLDKFKDRLSKDL